MKQGAYRPYKTNQDQWEAGKELAFYQSVKKGGQSQAAKGRRLAALPQGVACSLIIGGLLAGSLLLPPAEHPFFLSPASQVLAEGAMDYTQTAYEANKGGKSVSQAGKIQQESSLVGFALEYEAYAKALGKNGKEEGIFVENGGKGQLSSAFLDKAKSYYSFQREAAAYPALTELKTTPEAALASKILAEFGELDWDKANDKFGIQAVEPVQEALTQGSYAAIRLEDSEVPMIDALNELIYGNGQKELSQEDIDRNMTTLFDASCTQYELGISQGKEGAALVLLGKAPGQDKNSREIQAESQGDGQIRLLPPAGMALVPGVVRPGTASMVDLRSADFDEADPAQSISVQIQTPQELEKVNEKDLKAGSVTGTVNFPPYWTSCVNKYAAVTVESKAGSKDGITSAFVDGDQLASQEEDDLYSQTGSLLTKPKKFWTLNAGKFEGFLHRQGLDRDSFEKTYDVKIDKVLSQYAASLYSEEDLEELFHRLYFGPSNDVDYMNSLGKALMKAGYSYVAQFPLMDWSCDYSNLLGLTPEADPMAEWRVNPITLTYIATSDAAGNASAEENGEESTTRATRQRNTATQATENEESETTTAPTVPEPLEETQAAEPTETQVSGEAEENPGPTTFPSNSSPSRRRRRNAEPKPTDDNDADAANPIG